VIRVLYFAWLRERLGTGEEEVELPHGVASVAALVGWMRARSPAHAALFAETARLRCAVNQEISGPDAAIRAGDEVAFFPPVTGG
jgi:molybdopterin synthase sulfur carrier subunit